jgi:hypothetical protein
MFKELLDKLAEAINQNRSEFIEKTVRYSELMKHFATVGYVRTTEFDEEYEELENHLGDLQSRYERLSHTFDLIQDCQRADNVLEIAHILSNDHFDEWV